MDEFGINSLCSSSSSRDDSDRKQHVQNRHRENRRTLCPKARAASWPSSSSVPDQRQTSRHSLLIYQELANNFENTGLPSINRCFVCHPLARSSCPQFHGWILTIALGMNQLAIIDSLPPVELHLRFAGFSERGRVRLLTTNNEISDD